MGTGSVTGTHIAVALCDSVANGQITVFAVHVVCARTRIVTQPNAEVLDLARRTLVDLFQRNDFTGGLLELLQLAQEIPETGLGNNVVRSEDSHLVQRSAWLLLGGQLTADDFIFLQLKNLNKKPIKTKFRHDNTHTHTLASKHPFLFGICEVRFW